MNGDVTTDIRTRSQHSGQQRVEQRRLIGRIVRRTVGRRRLGLLVCCLLAATLAACAPRSEPRRADVQQLSENLSFYPRQTGAQWQYLPSGEPLNSPRLIRRVEGPLVIGGERLIAWRLVGRGIERRSYKAYQNDGVFIHREDGPGYILTYDPPLQELPAPAALRVGQSWQGSTQATLRYTETSSRDPVVTFEVHYRYDVVDRRVVSVEAGRFEVFVINLEGEQRDDDGTVRQRLQQQSWFTPYVGEVLTADEFTLVATNFQTEAAQVR
ncbi:MAG: hypothetical protein U5L04_07370 [Trueperaceae bacterium]|nr:hypothetical protein [Trueperaceae bacterium]